jgi:hypothetical protein
MRMLERYIAMPTGRRQMRLLSLLALLTSPIGACSQPEEVATDVSACAAKLYASYNPKNIDQCIAVCMTCSKGTKVTCSTSCNLKGAR